MPLPPCRDYMYTGKVRSTEKILSTQRRQIRIDRWCTLQVCHDFAVLEIWSESLDGDKGSRLKVRRAVYEDLLSQDPEKWFLCEIQETWGTTWIAAWNDPHVSEGTQEDQGPHVPMVDHLIATQATLEWLVGMNEEVFFRQSIETIYMVNVLVPTWIVEDLLSMRLTAQDTMSRLDQSKQMLIIERNPVSPTASWEEERCHFNALRITQGKATLVIRMTKEVQVLAILRILYHTPTNANLQWQPRGDASTKLPLFMEDTLPADGMHIVDFMTGPLSLEEHMFVSRKSDYVIALTPSGIFVMLRSKMGAIEDIIEALNPHFQQTMICQDHLGRMHGLETHPPDLVFVMPQTNPVEVDLDKLMKHQWTPNQDRAVIDLSMHDALWLLHQFTVLGWSDIIRALGWKTVLDSHPGSGITSPKQVQLSMTRCRNASGVALQALLNVLTTRLTLLLLNQAEPPESTGFAVQVKLWDSYIWEGMVTPETLSGKFASAWSKAASCFGRHDELRTIIRGRRTNPDWTIQHYLDDNATRDRPLRIHLILQLEGGGTKAEAAAKLKDDFTERVLQLGYDPIEAKQFVTQLYQEAGAARLRHVLALKEEEAFVQQCTLLSQQTRIKLPERFDLEAERTKKIKLQWRSKVAEPFPVNPAELTVEPGTFCRADDTEVKMQEQAMLVVWRHECPEETWMHLIEAPIQTVFKQLQIVPSEVIAGAPVGEYLYKISPLPEGVTAEDIQAWITLEKLPAKKSIGELSEPERIGELSETENDTSPPAVSATVRDNGFDSCDIRHLRKLKYYFQAAAINQLGIAEWSNAVMVDMPPRSAGAFSGAKAKGAATQKALSAEELRERGNAFFRDGAHSKAVRAYDEAIRAGPSDARCWANRAAAQMAMLAEFGKGLSPAALRSPRRTDVMNTQKPGAGANVHKSEAQTHTIPIPWMT
ncbi:unnamed protein product [Durusdinium trenchii]|uniref:Uncharacterized protein n=1 Tax=Durusdinium trenchii TaxID=1381693 RepID=A0ABP0MBE7_9DINO